MLLALLPLYFGEAYDGSRFERGGKDIERNDCSACDDAQYKRGSFHGRSLLVDLLACELGNGLRGSFLLTRAQGQDHPKVQKVGDFNMKR